MFSIIFAQTFQAIATNNEPNRLTDLEKIFVNIVTAAVPGAGLVLFVILLFGGLSYMSAGDDPKKVAGARQMITYAIIGMIVVAMAFLILKFIALFTGVDTITTFTVGPKPATP
jgi:hypothetical protein